MNKFGLIFRHYFVRSFKHPMNLFPMLLLPTVIILLFAFVNDYNIEENLLFHGYNVMHTNMVFANIFFFQLFGMFGNLESLHEFSTGEHKWRLFATPIKRTTFVGGILLGSWIVNILQGLIVFVVTGIILNVYWGNLLVTILAFLGISLFAQAMGVLLFVVTKNVAQATAIAYPLSFFIGALSGFIIPIQQLINHRIVDFMADWSPLTLASQAVFEGGRFGTVSIMDGTYTGGDMSLAIQSLLIIFATVAVLAAISFTLGKVKKVW